MVANHDPTEPITDVVLDRDIDQKSAPDPSERERAKWKLLAKNGPFAAPAELCDIWAGNTRDVETLNPRPFAELTQSIASIGQQVPAIARISPANPARLEIIAGACRLTAVRKINQTLPTEKHLRILVQLRELSNEAALQVVDAENRGRSDMSQYEKASFYERAIPGIYPTEQDLAAALGLNKSTVNRTLAVVRLPAEVMGLIKDRHAISAAQASEFLGDWNKPALRETLIETIADLAAQGPASAAAIFKALRESVEPPEKAECADIVHDGIGLGSLRRGKGGVAIKLLPTASEVALKPLVISIGNALKQIGFK